MLVSRLPTSLLRLEKLGSGGRRALLVSMSPTAVTKRIDPRLEKSCLGFKVSVVVVCTRLQVVSSAPAIGSRDPDSARSLRTALPTTIGIRGRNTTPACPAATATQVATRTASERVTRVIVLSRVRFTVAFPGHLGMYGLPGTTGRYPLIHPVRTAYKAS